jgi:hypothetical protein
MPSRARRSAPQVLNKPSSRTRGPRAPGRTPVCACRSLRSVSKMDFWKPSKRSAADSLQFQSKYRQIYTIVYVGVSLRPRRGPRLASSGGSAERRRQHPRAAYRYRLCAAGPPRRERRGDRPGRLTRSTSRWPPWSESPLSSGEGFHPHRGPSNGTSDLGSNERVDLDKSAVVSITVATRAEASSVSGHLGSK